MTVTMDDLRGRMLDTDSHLQLAPHLIPEVLGETFTEILRTRFWKGATPKPPAGGAVELGPEPDEENVWTLKMWQAPGASDASRRLRALDCMGIDRQLLFPMAIPAAMMLSTHP